MFDFAILRPQIRRYVRSSLWLALDGFRHMPWRVVFILAASFVGVSTAASSMGLVVWYIKWAQKPSPVSVFGVEIPLTEGSGSILVIGSAAMVFGLFSAVILLMAELSIQRLTRLYHHKCLLRVFEAAGHGRSAHIAAVFERIAARPTSFRNLIIGSRYTAFGLRSMVQSFLPLMTLTCAMGVLVWTNWLITALLSVLSVLFLAPLYVINRGVSRHHRNFRDIAPGVLRSIKLTLRGLLETSGPIRQARELWEEPMLKSPAFENMQDAFYGRVLAAKKTVFVNSVFLIICVFAILISFGIRGDYENASWAALLAYILALRFAWTSLKQVTTVVTNLSRFFTEFERHYDLDRAIRMAIQQAVRQTRALEKDGSFVIGSRGELDPEIGDTDSTIEIAQSEAVLALNPFALTGAAMYRLAETLGLPLESGDDAGTLTIFHLDPQPIAGVSIAGNALGAYPQPGELESLKTGLARLGVLEELESLRRGLDTVLTNETIKSLSAEAAFAITTAYCFIRPRPFVMLWLNSLRKTSGQFQRTFLAELSAARVLLVDSTTDRFFRPPLAEVRSTVGKAVLVLPDNVIRCGTIQWIEEQRDQIDGILDSLYAEAAQDSDAGDDEDLDDM